LQPPGRPYDAPQVPQGYYQEPAPQQPYYQEQPRNYVEPASPYTPQPSPYDAGQQNYGTGGELFGHDPSAQQDYGQNPYGAGTGYRQESFDSYAPRQDNAPRFYAPDDQRSAPPPALDRGYQPQQPPQPQPPALYNPQAAYEQQPAAQDNYQRGAFDPSFPPPAQGWEDEEPRSGRPPLAAHHDEFDEEFPDEDFDGDDYAPQKGSKKKLFAALLLSAAAVVVGGAYGYKMLMGKGERGTPLIAAEHSPSREAPENPGGKQFPHGEKAIYDRLSPDGRTQVAASFEAPPAAVPPAFGAPAVSSGAGSSLEDRIDEALKKAHGGRGDTPPADQPTVVHSENYRPDGTRVDSGRPVITPNIVNVDNGLPYPFGNAPSQPVAQPAQLQFRPAAAAPAQPQFATSMAAPPPAAKPVKTAAHTPPAPAPAPEPSTASAVPASAGGFFVSLKSGADEKKLQGEIPALTAKYKSVLGDNQISTQVVDLGDKGVTYRAYAGPFGTKQDAMDLCQKLKAVGGKDACFVPR
jgi:SPOR domain